MAWVKIIPKIARRNRFGDKIAIFFRRDKIRPTPYLLIFIGADLFKHFSNDENSSNRVIILHDDKDSSKFLIKAHDDGYTIHMEKTLKRGRIQPVWPFKLPKNEKTHVVKHEIVKEGIVFYID